MNEKAVVLASGLRVTYRSERDLRTAAHDLLLSLLAFPSGLHRTPVHTSATNVSRVVGGVDKSSINHPVSAGTSGL